MFLHDQTHGHPGALSGLSGLREEHTYWEGKWRVREHGGLEGGSTEQI